MVPSVRMLCPDGLIRLQQDHSSIHDSRVVQERLSRQEDVELINWPPGASSLPETAMSCGSLCQTSGMKLLRLSVTFDH